MNFDLGAIFKKAVGPVAGGVVAVAGYQLFVVAEQPPWLWIGIVFLGAAVLVAGFLLFRRVSRTRADSAAPAAAAAIGMVELAKKEKVRKEEALKALQRNWKEAVEFLRRSRLNKTGDPLYSLPWYMVIGEPNSGKTSAVRGAHLSSFAEGVRTTDTLVTKNCDWSFFEQAIVIDTAGRYTSQPDLAQDKHEWEKLLGLLVKYRRKESLNGLIVTVPADKLMKQSAEALETDGKNLRKRIDELMSTLGAKFPVYLQITKCDLIPGLPEICSRLSSIGLEQTMGCVNQDLTANAATFLNTAFSKMGDRLKSTRLLLADQHETKALTSDILLFPETFFKLQEGLAAMTQGAFQENPFQETPLLRGVFFSSGVIQNGHGPGVFLHDFFSKILPADRSLFVPTRKTLRWRRDVLNVKVISWFAATTLFAAMMTVSFIKNLNMLRDSDRAFSHLAPLKGDRAADIETLHQRFEILRGFERKNQSGWYSHFALNEAGRVNRVIGDKLGSQFRATLLAPLDDQYTRGLAELNGSSSNVIFSQYMGHLVGRIRAIKARLAHNDLSLLNNAPLPIPFLRLGQGEANADLKMKFGALYTTSLRWFDNEAELQKELTRLQAQLKRALSLKGNSPQWVVAWANSQQSGPPITLREYWGGEATISEASVPAIFSRKNKDLIDSFFSEIETALENPTELAELKSEFSKWYRTNATDAWRKFAVAFVAGPRLLNKEQWRRMVPRMAKNENPYYRVLNDIATELEPVTAQLGTNVPVWLKEIYRFRELQQPGMHFTFSSLGLKGSPAATLPSSEAFTQYRKSLDKTASAVDEPAKAAKAAADAFSPASIASVFGKGFASLNKLNASLTAENLNDPAIGKLISGPFDFLWSYARNEAAERLQADWESKVLAETSGFTGPQALTALLGQDGPVLKFVREQGDSYILWKPGKGFYANDAFGSIVPLTGSFFTFLNRGAKASMLSRIDNLNVSITASTPQTNEGAKRLPHIVRLELLGSGKPQVLIGKRTRVFESNFDTSEKSFHWTPDCSDVILEIVVAGSHLVKRYPGPYGFFTFLGEFRGGRHTFYAREFPNEAAALAQLGITSITVRYKIKGAPDLDAPASVPTTIIAGWGE